KQKPLLHRARRRVPASVVWKLLEIRRVDQRACEIDRIVDSGCDGYPLITVGHRVDIVVFGNHGLVTVRCAVFPYIPRAEIRGDDLQVTRAGGAACSGSKLPRGGRISLPCRFPRSGGIEVKSPGLSTRVRVDMKGAVVFPRDVQPPRQS